ncbi:MAG: hypothetical protein WBV85_08040 [Solirubrobacteraceae bacterium]
MVNLSGGTISATPLVGESLSCTPQKLCGEEAILWHENLPWQTLLELVEELEEGVLIGSPFFAILTTGTGGEPAYYFLCKTLGVTSVDVCFSGSEVAEAANVAGGAEVAFSLLFTELVQIKLGLCTLSNGETGIIEGSGIFSLESGTEVLSVSSIG